jgi:hypothetical protein
VLSKELEVSMSQACHSAGVPSYQQSSRPGMPVYTSTRDSQSRGSASTLVSQTARAAGTQSRSAVNISSPRDMSQPSSGNLLTPGCSLWIFPGQVNVPKKAVISTEQENDKKRLKQSALVQSDDVSPPLLPDLPFMNAEDIPDPGRTAMPILKPCLLYYYYYSFPINTS